MRMPIFQVLLALILVTAPVVTGCGGGDDDDASAPVGDDDTEPGDDDTEPGDDDTEPGDDDTAPGDDDTEPGDDDTEPGDDDTAPGDDDTEPGDDDTEPGDDDTDPGDDDTVPGDDDTEPGDDDTAPGDDDTSSTGTPVPARDDDHDGYPVEQDCDDSSPSIHPGAAETCDQQDNDCDFEIDEGVQTTWYADSDGDGFGTTSTVRACSRPDGYAEHPGDCDDWDPAKNPGALEVCDSRDNDCDDTVDEGFPTSVYYPDNDYDGYGTADPLESCSRPEGYAAQSGDCNDQSSYINPGATEVCDGLDNDCDGQIDGGVLTTWYPDNDYDGFGTGTGVQACSAPSFHVDRPGDCDDSNPSIHPGATELCDQIDNDCDNQIDEDLPTWYRDADGDGYGTQETKRSCTEPPGFADETGDCDDSEPSIHPNAYEACDEVDNDCDGTIDEGATHTWYLDEDWDGYGSDVSIEACGTPWGYTWQSGDCNDQEPSAHPGAEEVCDLLDNDCDSRIDEDVLSTFYEDLDGDGFGAGRTQQGCSVPVGYAAKGGDCDDDSELVYPGALEACDGLDNDCDGQLDEGVQSLYFRDDDGDGYGDGDAVWGCSPPAGYTAEPGDCDDTDVGSFPGALEACDDQDNDCDGQVDDGLPKSWFRDQDQDGFGVTTTAACGPRQGYVAARGDCDDTNTAIRPGAADAADSIDQDCGGTKGPDPHVGLSSSSATSISAALALAQDGTTVWVGPGTYLEAGIDFNGRSVKLYSTQLQDSTIIDANQQSYGIVFKKSEKSTAILDGFTVRNASKSGLYIYYASPTIQNFTLTASAGAQLTYSYSAFQNCVFKDNRAENGGGLTALSSAMTLRDCRFEGNRASYSGGGMYLSDSSAQLIHVTFLSNKAYSFGGGLAMKGGYAPELTSTSFISNSADLDGGGIYVADGRPTFDDCLFEGNVAQSGGGGYFYNAIATLRSCRFQDNAATKTDGGALWVGDGTTFSLSQSLVTGNQAAHGSGLEIDGATVDVTYTAFLENVATTNDCIRVHGDSSLSLSQSLLVGNSSTNSIGGLELDRTDSDLAVEGSILADNGKYNLWVYGSTGKLSLGYNDLFSSSGSNHNLAYLPATNVAVNPELMPDGIHLALNSPLIDAGDPGEADPDGSRADIGLFGGPDADLRDVDGDGVTDYYWPGTILDAPEGEDPGEFDCDDSNGAVQECSM